MIRIREAAVAGSFYPADPGELRSMLHRMLDAVVTAAGPPPKALIVPHAGYVYSGPVAAVAYASLLPHAARYRRVVLLGPSHRVAFHGLAATEADTFRTPLGDVPIDCSSLHGLRHEAVDVIDAAHRSEHSLEVQLPFLQMVLPAFKLLPLVVGDARVADVSSVLELLWGGPETLLVISSDLSHYLPYGQACELDRATCKAIEALDGSGIDGKQACGAIPLRGLLLAAGRRGLRPQTLDLRNSGDTSGSRDQVVGYGAWMLAEEVPCRHAA